MAKRKTKTSESFDDWISREHGKDVLISAYDVVERKRDVLPTILSLDIALSGGIPDGTICLLSGKPKIGKTSLCLHILKNAIELNRPTYYLDIERRCKAGLLKTVRNLNMSKLQMIRENDESFSAEQWLNILERIIKETKKSVIVVDSIAMLSTLTEQSEKLGSNKDMAGSPKLLSSFFRRMQQTIDKNDIIILFISQLMTNRDPMSRSKWVEKGGNAIQYSCSAWISATWAKSWEKNIETGAPDGHHIHCKIMTSALGKPFLPCSIPLRYGSGLDKTLDIINNAENLGLIQKTGSWYSIPMLTEERFQGIGKLREWLIGSQEKETLLEKEIRSMVFPDAS
jgi:recombination protein RecA